VSGARHEALLILADGQVFEGEALGALGARGALGSVGTPALGPASEATSKDPGRSGTGRLRFASGELVFNTCLSGYQEVLTDPSYAGQVIAFTYPHIGNYGVSPEDDQAGRPFCRGVVVRDVTDRPSNWRSAESLEAYLVRHGVPGITGVDTRRLTRHIREAGAMPCVIGLAEVGERALLEVARREPGTAGVDLVAEVTTAVPYSGPASDSPLSVVAYDYGIKSTILHNLSRVADVEVVPATTPASEVLSRGPDGVFLSNGPGDPAALGQLVSELHKLVGQVPIFGICLGHQLLATALGAETYKLRFGHHGGNHPVKRLATGSVEITSQNHGYAVADGTVTDAEVTHVNLNDGVVEGLRNEGARLFSVQYHPEAGPGPHDARYLFDDFKVLMEASR
jgi:carbamoyl-phosphate synthase small subunit